MDNSRCDFDGSASAPEKQIRCFNLRSTDLCKRLIGYGLYFFANFCLYSLVISCRSQFLHECDRERKEAGNNIQNTNYLAMKATFLQIT